MIGMRDGLILKIKKIQTLLVITGTGFARNGLIFKMQDFCLPIVYYRKWFRKTGNFCVMNPRALNLVFHSISVQPKRQDLLTWEDLGMFYMG